MEQHREAEYWVIWYPSYTYKNFELIEKDYDHPIIEDLTDSYFSNTHTYLKIEPYLSEGEQNISENKKKENILLSFYKITRKKSRWFQFKVFLFRKGILRNRPLIKPIKNILPQLTETSKLAQIDLIYKQHSPEGLFVYECQADENSKKFLSEGHSLLEDKDQYTTFYCIKQLYHTHLFHKKSNNNESYKDYYFRAFLAKEEPNITEVNNAPLMFFLNKTLEYFVSQLKHFEEIKTNTNADIIAQKRQIDKAIKELKESVDSITENEEKDSCLKKIWEEEINKRSKAKEKLIVVLKEKKDKRGLFLISNDIVGETLFTNILCCSEYLNKENNEIRMALLNIENIKTGLYYIRDNYRYWYDRSEAKKSSFLSKVSVMLGYLGYIVGICSILYAFYSNLNTDGQIKSAEIKAETDLKAHIDSCFIDLKQHLDLKNNK